MKLQSLIDLIACILVLMGGLNWGLVGLLDFDLVASIFGKKSSLSRTVYSIVGLAALHVIYLATGEIPNISRKGK
ncbi:MAG: uncharacterized protein QG646_3578 [Euryarchaeota archaeon]|nr:uncharacterized protein [Euryarchaeota archaeon]